MPSNSMGVDERIGREAEMPQHELDYLRRRAEAELEMAQRSETPEATAAHYQLAEAYLEQIQAQEAAPGEEGPDRLGSSGAASVPPASEEAEGPPAGGQEKR